ncbi:MAG: hypothetical protein MJ069_06495 [Salinivirgaceae bacterium]|nr:hypothetical protein [Salinivirgaceae bacterium]
MRSDIFNFKRYWDYQKRVITEYPLTWVALALGIVSLIVATFVKSYAVGNFMVSFFVSCLMILGMFWKLCKKNECLIEMLIPASMFEKYLSRMVYYSFLPCLIWGASIMLTNEGLIDSHEPILFVAIMCSSVLINVVTKFWGYFLYCMVGSFSKWTAPYAESIPSNGVEMWITMAVMIFFTYVVGYFLFKRQSLTLKDLRK